MTVEELEDGDDEASIKGCKRDLGGREVSDFVLYKVMLDTGQYALFAFGAGFVKSGANAFGTSSFGF
ncbi:unnamed protein product [Linum trigynum]|uniref:Uncharacterized protein n=1 Tax=Linum trigynum TaxID=586398 RepID=A0AAV2FD89_9ROSI